ncbi:MAG: prepilin-type N-terminal cleavage/methylation domain-containing protein [Candidatus Pacebacteria bacterium]|nr:prepilin-type N-terminal cleavage/methylation domain-containing protein [Candidatus Paceibacterota bacterium]
MNNKGFTLIEALVSISIFIAISVTLAQVITVSIQNQIKVISEQNMFDQAVFALDQMEKELRMAKKDTDGICVVPGTNYGRNNSSSTIKFKIYDQASADYRCREFSLNDNSNSVRQRTSTNSSPLIWGDYIDLTSSSVYVQSLSFTVNGDNDSDNEQPKVTINLKMKSGVIDDSEGVELQTTISQRRLDF